MWGAEPTVIFCFVTSYFIMKFYVLWNAIHVLGRAIANVSKARGAFAFGVTHSFCNFDPECESLESSVQNM
jgi:hypothetical protein